LLYLILDGSSSSQGEAGAAHQSCCYQPQPVHEGHIPQVIWSALVLLLHAVHGCLVKVLISGLLIDVNSCC
jgi:hypothetical protein